MPTIAEFPALSGRRSVALRPETITSYDAVVIVTDHDAVDYTGLVRHARLLIDTRNVCERNGLRAATIVKS